jgi:hypothetical protein
MLFYWNGIYFSRCSGTTSGIILAIGTNQEILWKPEGHLWTIFDASLR